MARCASCNAEIVWARTVTGKASPMERADDGTWAIANGQMRSAIPTDVERYRSHFVSCPQAGQWRKRA